MNERFGRRFVVWNGILLVVMLVTAFALDLAIWNSTGGPPAIDLNHLSTDLVRANGSSLWPIETWLYILLVIPGLTFTIGVKSVLKHPDQELLLVTAKNSMILFWIFHTLHNVVLLTVLYGAASYSPADTTQALNFESVADMLLRFSNLLFGFGTSIGALFLVFALGLFGYLTYLNKKFTNRIAFIALGASIAILLSYLQSVSGVFFALGLLGWVLFIFWVFSMTFRLAKGDLED